MRSWNRPLLAAILAGTLSTAMPLVAAGADDDAALNALLAQADARSAAKTRAQSQAPAKPGAQAKLTAARPAPVLDDKPRPRDTALAVGGGLLVVVLAAIGLTITFRSLRADLRGRRHRYRRRIRREPRSA